MALFDLTEFLKLSSVLNYNLSATSLNRYNVLLFILRETPLSGEGLNDQTCKHIAMETLSYLLAAYSNKRRRLGPMAVIHPIRAAALLARAKKSLDIQELLAILLHDILEDINPTRFPAGHLERMEVRLFDIFERLGAEHERQLVDNLSQLTRRRGESYYQYIGRLLAGTRHSTRLVQVKLADRLDNTLDMRIDLQDPLEGTDFFEGIFQTLFVHNYRRDKPDGHPTPSVLNGARRLHQLFKNAMLLSLIRQNVGPQRAREYKTLFEAVCSASLKEAQRTLVHLVSYHYQDITSQRELLLDAMEYCYSGRSDLVTKPDRDHNLDGLFATYFAATSKSKLNQKLDLLYQDKPLMIQASTAFITIFFSFINDERFFVRGLSTEGVTPH